MPHITYEDPKGNIHDFEVADGVTVMAVAKKNGVPGMVAECGGSLTCASCHVYVDPAWEDEISAPGVNEDEMLDEVASPREPNSRLSCQIVITEDLDGLMVRLPPRQQ